MQKITVTYEVYEYKELAEDAKNKVINNYINFIIECVPYKYLSENMKKAVDKANSMQTPWFTGSYIYEYALDEILEGVKQNKYLIDGKIFN